MKLFSTFVFLFIMSFISAQSTVSIDKKQVYLGEIDINNVVSIDFNLENLSDKVALLSYEPITNLVNASFPNPKLKPKEKGLLKVNFYPETEGPFSEKLILKINETENIELNIYGTVATISKSYKSLSDNSKLFGDRDISFMLVDGISRKGVPYSKIFIRNVENNKSYIGISDNYGVLVNRIPEGKYKIQALIDGYKQESLDIKLDMDRNIAMILLERTETFDTAPKQVLIKKIIAPKKDTIKETIKPKLQDTIEEIQNTIAEEPAVNIETEAPKPVVRFEANATRKPLNIILLLDVSKSMEKPNRIGILKKSIVNLVQNYEPNDQLAILTFNDKVTTIMERKKIDDKKAVIQMINSILPSGTTDGVLGIDKAFEILQASYMPEAMNMVIIASDGKISNTSYDDKLIFEKIESMNEKGILTSVVGFATSSYEQTKLNKIASLGGGIYLNMNVDVENMENMLLNEIYGTLLKLK